eukprot:6321682-Prymnesium_polylepis.1
MTITLALGGWLGGALLTHIGFAWSWATIAIIIAQCPLFIFVGFHPKVMKRCVLTPVPAAAGSPFTAKTSARRTPSHALDATRRLPSPGPRSNPLR